MAKSSLSSKLRSSSPADMAAGEGAKVRESLTISTQDSLEQSTTDKKSKRGSKKKSSKTSSNSSSLEESLSELAMEDSVSSKHVDDPTVATTDSRERNKSEKKDSKTRRGAKKQRSPLTPLDLETSLTELLTDEEEPASPTVRESLTISTLDSLDMDGKNKKKSSRTATSSSNNNNSNSLSPKWSKRGTKKPSTSLSSVLGKLDAPKDFGRDCDDNDTFCGLGTVGEKELARGSPHLTNTKPSPSVKKTKIVSPAQHKKISKSTSSDCHATGLGGNRMMMPSHDSDSEEEDLFESFESNPFRVPYH